MMARLQSNLQVGAFIASGGFGAVHLGDDPIQGQVAVKIFRQRPDEPAAAWTTRKCALLAEGQRLRHASHPNVVQVHQLLESPTEDEVLLAMEFCSGRSLQDSFDAGPMTLDEVRRHATAITLGLQALHDRGMLHRDIKPGNILIDQHGVHLAPEVHHGRPTSVRTDIWALGMTIYRLLHGAVWYAKSPPPRTLVPLGCFANRLLWLPHIPKPWRRFIRKALNDDPVYRHQTASEVINALATLPTTPDWRCVVGASEVSWRRRTPSRQINAVWTEYSARRHEWTAWSDPIGSGRRRLLDGSHGKIGRADTDRQLQGFFATHV
jgi:serine/threonine protein kinase